MVKFHVVTKAIQSSSSLPLITNFNLLVIMQKHNSKTAMIIDAVHWFFLLDWIHLICYSKDVIPYTTLSKQSAFPLVDVFFKNNRNWPNTIYFWCPCLLRGVCWIEVCYEGKFKTLISWPGLMSTWQKVSS